jgi:hypothetical protein
MGVTGLKQWKEAKSTMGCYDASILRPEKHRVSFFVSLQHPNNRLKYFYLLFPPHPPQKKETVLMLKKYWTGIGTPQLRL